VYFFEAQLAPESSSAKSLKKYAAWKNVAMVSIISIVDHLGADLAPRRSAFSQHALVVTQHELGPPLETFLAIRDGFLETVDHASRDRRPK